MKHLNSTIAHRAALPSAALHTHTARAPAVPSVREHHGREEPGRARHDHPDHHAPSHRPEGWPRTALSLASFPLHEVICAVQAAVPWTSGKRRCVGGARTLRQGGGGGEGRGGGWGRKRHGLLQRRSVRCRSAGLVCSPAHKPSSTHTASRLTPTSRLAPRLTQRGVLLGDTCATIPRPLQNPILPNCCHEADHSTQHSHGRTGPDWTELN